MDAHLVELDQDHPGFRDPVYRRRRDEIAKQAQMHVRGTPAPYVEYLEAEQKVWATALDALNPLHARYAAKSYLDAWPKVGFTKEHVPQLSEVGARLTPLTGFSYAPVTGLVTPADFLMGLESGLFLATQYMRHPSLPLYTPEPDVIHELVGHAPSLADPRYCDITRLFGRACHGADARRIEQLIRVYWFSLEFGLVREGGNVKAVGAGLLSSFGELGRFETEATLLPHSIDAIVRTPYDPTHYQPQLFVAESEAALLETLRRWLEPMGA